MSTQEHTDKLTELGDVLTSGTELDRNRPKGKGTDRLEIQFEVETVTTYPAGKKLTKRTKPLKGAVLLRYVEQPAKTPTGGRFIARRLLVSIGGRRWVGQMKNGTNVVRLRPEPKNKEKE